MSEDDFIKLISKDLDIDDLPLDAQKDIVARLGETALKNTIVVVIDKLPEDVMAEFEKLSESSDLDKTRYFLKKHIPDFDNLANSEIKKVVDNFKRVKAGLS